MPKCSKESVPSLHLRRANNADIAAMLELEHQSLTAAHWSRQQYEGMFATGDSGSPSRLILVAEGIDELRTEVVPDAQHRIRAFLVAHRVDKEWELENIVVAEESRRQGVGTRLLFEFIEQALTGGAAAIFLEVRQSNQPARAFYRRAGFVEIGLRKGYYVSPPEDAILYRLGLS
jgi:ribosomal-protein-alanine N-acetyltransferase